MVYSFFSPHLLLVSFQDTLIVYPFLCLVKILFLVFEKFYGIIKTRKDGDAYGI
nr:MAG TPA: hypothetical protein [Caudoviricetes sp.]